MQTLYSEMSQWVFKKDQLPNVTDFSQEMILCKEFEQGGKVYRSFAVKKHSEELNKLLLGRDAHFYECVPGDAPRKMYFDLDFPKVNGKSEAKSCLRKVVNKLKELGSERIMVFCSSSEKKDSFHVVAVDMIARDNYHAKYVASHEFSDMGIDLAVYSRFQQFRCFRSCKIGTQRIKNATDFSYLPSKKAIDILPLSILTYLTGEEKILPHYDESRPPVRASCDWTDGDKFDSLDEIIASVSPFMDFLSQDDSLVLFRRHSASFCEECQRDHEGENPFMVIKTNGDVIMHCRRSEEKIGVFMGNIRKKVDLVKEEPVIKPSPIRKLIKLC